MGFDLEDDLLSELPIIGSLFDNSDEEFLKRYQEALKELSAADPRLDEYRQTYTEFNPQLVQHQLVDEDPLLREGQMEMLQRLAGLSETGLSEVDALALEDLRQAAAAAEQSSTQNALRDARSRGMAGGGLEFALRQQGAQGGAEQARRAAFEKAAQTAQQRALYTKAYGDALGNVRGDDFRKNQYNTNVMNTFNRYNTELMNKASLRNIDEQNRVRQDNFENMRGYAQDRATVHTNKQLGDYWNTKRKERGEARKNNLGTAVAGFNTLFPASGGGGQ